MGDILFICPACSKRLAAPDTGAGKKCRCFDCQAEVKIPDGGMAFSCPTCHHQLLAPSRYSGLPFTCPECNTALSIPAFESPRAAVATSVQWQADGLKFNCGSCNQRLNVPDAMLGKSIRCPACQMRIQLPAKRPVRISI